MVLSKTILNSLGRAAMPEAASKTFENSQLSELNEKSQGGMYILVYGLGEPMVCSKTMVKQAVASHNPRTNCCLQR